MKIKLRLVTPPEPHSAEEASAPSDAVPNPPSEREDNLLILRIINILIFVKVDFLQSGNLLAGT